MNRWEFLESSAAAAVGVGVFAPWYEDVFRQGVPGLDKGFEVDVHGQPQARVCDRNPNTLNSWLGLTEDYLRSYNVDGLMFGSERQGLLNNALGASHGGADRIILSRKYSEMRLDNLRAAGRAIRESVKRA